MWRPILLLVVLSVPALPAKAQQTLPHSFGHWSAATPGNAPAIAPSPEVSPAILAEYGLDSSETGSYVRAGGDASHTWQATVFRMKDPTGGYGLYSYLRGPGMVRSDLSEHASLSRERALILLGNLVIEVRGRDLAKAGPDLKSLVGALRPHAQAGPLPSLWQLLPPKGIVEGTDRYIAGPQALNQLFPAALGDSLGFSTGVEAELARYRSGGREAVLLIADFPTPQLAKQGLADLRMKFNVNGSRSGDSSPALFAKRSLTLLAIVAGPSSQQEAAVLLDQVHPGTALTWDEPTFQFKEPRIEVMIVGTIIGTGVICVFALVAGLAFGGLRLLVKRILPNKVFDRGHHLQVLQLGLSSKPINAEDFYGTGGSLARESKTHKDLPDRIALRLFR
jgi:hypothetical protein